MVQPLPAFNPLLYNPMKVLSYPFFRGGNRNSGSVIYLRLELEMNGADISIRSNSKDCALPLHLLYYTYWARYFTKYFTCNNSFNFTTPLEGKNYILHLTDEKLRPREVK